MAQFEVKVKGIPGKMAVEGERIGGTDQVLYIFDSRGQVVFSAPQAEILYARQLDQP